MPIEAYTTKQIDEMIQYFRDQGYQVVDLDERSLITRKQRPGQGLGEACGDDRYEDGDPDLASYLEGPASFGGIEARASMYARKTGKGIKASYDWAAKVMRNEQGFEPATHIVELSAPADNPTDPLAIMSTCAAVRFHMDNMGLTPEQLQYLRDQQQVQVARLRKPHTGEVMVIDNRPGVRVIQNRKWYLVTASNLAQLGFEPCDWNPDVAKIGRAVLPSEVPPRVAFLR